MARRRVLSVDTSDGLANLVMGFLAVLIIASLALIPLLGSADEPEPAAQTTDDEPSPQVVPPAAAASPPAGEADGADAGGADGSGDADANTVDPDGTSAGDIPAAPVDDLTVEGAASAAAGLVSPPSTGEGGTGAASAIPTPTPSAPATPPASPTPSPTPTAAPSSEPAPTSSPSVPSAGGGVVVPPEPDDDPFRPDDPDRVPDVHVRRWPRGTITEHADVDGDGTHERVWSAIVADVVLTRVDEPADDGWDEGEAGHGAVAGRLVALHVADLTGDGRPEIWTRQWVASEGESITLWAYVDGRLQRMDASGGCWHGSNTFGLMGALVQPDTPGRPTQIAAICEDEGQPWWQWPSALYRWEAGRWTLDRTVGKYR